MTLSYRTIVTAPFMLALVGLRKGRDATFAFISRRFDAACNRLMESCLNLKPLSDGANLCAAASIPFLFGAAFLINRLP